MGGDEIREGPADLGFIEAPRHVWTGIVCYDNPPGDLGVGGGELGRDEGYRREREGESESLHSCDTKSRLQPRPANRAVCHRDLAAFIPGFKIRSTNPLLAPLAVVHPLQRGCSFGCVLNRCALESERRFLTGFAPPSLVIKSRLQTGAPKGGAPLACRVAKVLALDSDAGLD